MSPLLEFKEKISPQRSALIIVDLQNDFCDPQGAWARVGLDPDLSQRLTCLKAFLPEVRTRGVPVLWLRTIYNDWTVSPPIQEWWERLGIGRLCSEGSWGADFYQLVPEEKDRVLNKYRASAFMETDLDLTLRANEVGTLLIAGIGVWGGLFETARDGLAKNYDVVLLEDCIAGGTPQERSMLLDLYRRYYGVIAPSSRVLEGWR